MMTRLRRVFDELWQGSPSVLNQLPESSSHCARTPESSEQDCLAVRAGQAGPVERRGCKFFFAASNNTPRFPSQNFHASCAQRYHDSSYPSSMNVEGSILVANRNKHACNFGSNMVPRMCCCSTVSRSKPQSIILFAPTEGLLIRRAERIQNSRWSLFLLFLRACDRKIFCKELGAIRVVA